MMTHHSTDLRRMLIIDDNPSIHDDFRKTSQRDEGGAAALKEAASALFGDPPSSSLDEQYELDFAFQGQEGFEKVLAAQDEERAYAMALLDVRMPPGWDGVETAAKIIDCDPRYSNRDLHGVLRLLRRSDDRQDRLDRSVDDSQEALRLCRGAAVHPLADRKVAIGRRRPIAGHVVAGVKGISHPSAQSERIW